MYSVIFLPNSLVLSVSFWKSQKKHSGGLFLKSFGLLWFLLTVVIFTQPMLYAGSVCQVLQGHNSVQSSSPPQRQVPISFLGKAGPYRERHLPSGGWLLRPARASGHPLLMNLFTVLSLLPVHVSILTDNRCAASMSIGNRRRWRVQDLLLSQDMESLGKEARPPKVLVISVFHSATPR